MFQDPLPQLINELNGHLKGWANYFSYGYPRERVSANQPLRAPTIDAARSAEKPTAF